MSKHAMTLAWEKPQSSWKPEHVAEILDRLLTIGAIYNATLPRQRYCLLLRSQGVTAAKPAVRDTSTGHLAANRQSPRGEAQASRLHSGGVCHEKFCFQTAVI